ncbi:Protein jagged-2-like isoform X2 [Aphelenchoides fujianensis]|nr:Protein jagged-2-like isoform X2 [Aphelenchoides fujianensis]
MQPTSGRMLGLVLLLSCSLWAKSEPTEGANSTFVNVNLAKLDISRPPRPCCSTAGQRGCQVCAYECTLIMSETSSSPVVFVHHRFNCSLSTVGVPMRIPLLHSVDTHKITVMLYVRAANGDQLVVGETTVQTAQLKYAPDSSVFKMMYRDQYSVEFNVSVECLEGFAGPHCEVACPAPTEKDHYKCARAGKICLTGWMGVDCNTPVCSLGCGKGVCVNPEQCRCPNGWKGPRCAQCEPKSGCVNGECAGFPGQCKCRPGFSGELCNAGERSTEDSTAAIRSWVSVLFGICIVLIVLVVVLILWNVCPVRAWIGANRRMDKLVGV